MKVWKSAIVLLMSLLIPGEAAALVRTVDAGGFGDYSTIQSAVDASLAGDELHVAAGTYYENVTMKDGVSLYGGYSASGWSRDITVNVTVMDAGGSGSTVTASDNATLDGFTITGSASTGIVAGVYISGKSPAISNNIITGNGRHGVYIEDAASPAIRENVIKANTGYGLYCYSFGNGGAPNIYNNVVDGNLRGIHVVAFDPSLRNNIVSSNSEYGIYVDVFSTVGTDYNDVWDNTQGDYFNIAAGPHDISADPLFIGGGDYHLSDSPALSPCIDAGVDVGLPYNGLPDIGRYESATTRDTPWPPEGLSASPFTAKVYLEWLPNKEPDIAGYKVSYGTAPGVYTGTLNVGNVTEYMVDSLINGAAYFFALTAYNAIPNESGYSAEVSATPSAGSPELPHYNWDPSFGGGDCASCHRTQGGSNLLPAGFDYRYDTGLCLSCHNVTGQARALLVDQAKSHPVFVNATTGGDNIPVYGNITGRFSNRMGDHLDPAGRVVCNTCHNVMEKTEDPGRVWEPATFTGEDSWLTYRLANGGWSYYGYMEPDVYSAATLTAKPTYVEDRRPMRLDDTLSNYFPETGKIKFKTSYFDYPYVTLGFPYLRVDNSGNVMCLDCHNTATHELMNCLTCHDTHNYTNRLGIKPKIRTQNSGFKNVAFTAISGPGSFADGDSVYDGVCEVCHTQTLYHRNNGSVMNNHTGTGLDYSGQDCLACHTHVGGFYP